MLRSIHLKSSKRTRLGNYICKIGYFDIRQRITYPSKKVSKGNVEVFVCQGKHKLAGPFKSHEAARVHAEELMSEGYRYVKHKKR
tara:strand:- start:2059 stop:2313 length:255 start_codon:yes stop_codon:yes gene_type:complete